VNSEITFFSWCFFLCVRFFRAKDSKVRKVLKFLDNYMMFSKEELIRYSWQTYLEIGIKGQGNERWKCKKYFIRKAGGLGAVCFIIWLLALVINYFEQNQLQLNLGSCGLMYRGMTLKPESGKLLLHKICPHAPGNL